MNERADKLADLGAQTTTHFRAGRPLRQRETYQYSSSLPRPTIRPIYPRIQCQTDVSDGGVG